MATVTFDASQFRTQFPEFSNETTYPDATLQMYWNNATCYVSPNENRRLGGSCLQLALNYMTAHLLTLANTGAAGGTAAIVSNAGIDKVTVGATPPPVNDQWKWELNTTNYGLQLLTLLSAKGSGGFVAGGSLRRLGLR